MTALHSFFESIHSERGTRITYKRGELSVELDAVPSTAKLNSSETQGFRIEKADRKYMILAEQLLFGDKNTMPQVNDRIIESDREYTVVKVTDKQAYQPMENTETLIRIFAMRIK